MELDGAELDLVVGAGDKVRIGFGVGAAASLSTAGAVGEEVSLLAEPGFA